MYHIMNKFIITNITVIIIYVLFLLSIKYLVHSVLFTRETESYGSYISFYLMVVGQIEQKRYSDELGWI